MKLNKLGPNTSVLTTKQGEILFSYDTPVAIQSKGVICRTSKKYSSTTTKHINQYVKANPHLKVKEVNQEFIDIALVEC